MANKSVYEVGVSTPITLKRIIILFLLGIIYLTLVEAGPVEVDRHAFEHPPVRTFYFKESDNLLYLDISANVWISSDAGANWNLVSGVPRNVAAALIEHSFSHDKAYIITNDKTHYKTSDKGKTWQEFTTPIPPARKVQILSFHAHREDYVLFRGTECTHFFECTDITYYTTENFAPGSIKLLLENTDKCIWAHNSVKFDEAPTTSIFCIQYDVTGSGSMRKLSDYRLVESENYFGTPKIVDFNTGGDVRGVIGLGESQEFLAAAVKDPNSLDMKMYISVDGQQWARAFFPLNKGPKEEAYTILESPTNHLVVDLLDSKHSTGSLYISNSNGTYFVNRLKHTNRNKLGLSDFKLSNVGGHFLANIVSNFEEINSVDDDRKKLQSKISFDDGFTWRFIKPPEKNLGDTDFPCRGDWEQGQCSLHLHLVTTAHNNGHMFSSSAPGVLMGVGNVGEYLLPYEQCDTFLSYDGGLTWKVVKLGAHMFGIGHYGSILVIVDDEQPTDHILYSYDRGEHWYKKDLNTKIRARLLTTDSDSKSKTFLLLGAAVPDHDTPNDGGNYRHFTFKLDFSNLFGRECNGNDFDDWFLIRSGPGSDSDCFMGRKTTYHRRKADAQCFVSELPGPDNIDCACTKRDYECDFNYIFDKDEEKCIPLVPERIPDGECKDGKKTYLGSSGFRLIPDNHCDPDRGESIRHDPVERECNSLPIFGDVSHRTANFALETYFYFPESQVLMIKTIDGKVKRSDDEGTTWKDVLLDAGPIANMYRHDHDNNRAYFFPVKAEKSDNKYYMWYTTDRGESFDKTKLENEPNKLNIRLLDFHPKEKDWLLFMASIGLCPKCNSITYFSSDNGKSWEEIETWADKCMFGKDTDFSETGDDIVFCSSYKYKNSNTPQDELGGRTSNPLQLVRMKTNGESKNVILSDVVNFFIFNEFMAVATEERGQLLLHTSTNGVKFANATFPPHLSVNKQAFTLLPSATGSIFLDTYKSLRFGYGSLFKSNSEGTFFNRILDDTNRNIFGNVDFEKVAGLDGIILANQVENVDELDGLGEFAEKKIITKISHDDGSRWKRLKMESKDDCQDDCYLNLHGRTDVYVPDNIFSAPSAVGLLIGVGNVGRYLLPYNQCNTYMSRDGGKTWKEIRRGASLYEFGDQGTIIVVVDNKGPTDHVRFSWDYGDHWERYQFTSTPFRALFITANLNSTSMKFLLYGYTTHDTSPVLVTIDFSQLEKKKCEKSDLELWNPMENSGDHKCLLGERREYWRRKQDSKCKIGYKLEPEEPEICECTKHDFDCADGYWRNAKGDCELMGPDPERPANCRNTYRGHSGYVKMKKTKCEGGENFDKMVDKNCDSGNIIISKTSVFEHRIIEYFYFNTSRIILARTKDGVWRGTNEGHTWEVPAKLQNVKVYSIIHNPYFDEYAYCITLDKKIFYTSDSGNSFKEFSVKMNPNNFQIPILNFHPDKPEYLIYTGSEGCEDVLSSKCYAEAFYSSDNGKLWTSLEKYVRVCQWARNKKFRPSDDKLIVCESYRDKEGSQLLFYNNPLQLVPVSSFKNNEPINHNIVGTAIFEEYMIVAELLSSGQSLRLLVSLDAKIFAEAQFPPNIPITQEAYTALQSTTNAIMLHVTTSSIRSKNKYGSILKSNGNGTYYSLSLENANRDDIGFVDFEKMQGIQGIAISNIVSNVYEANMGSDKELKTKITFNDGATWNLLKRPDADSNGHRYKCHSNPVDKCSLHLHSYTERRNPRDSLSSSSAIGLMMGVGNVGAYLTPYLEGDTFLTRDAGLTWIEVKKGAYMYEFGNQGGILVLVDDEHLTDHVLYSLNEGLEWREYKFTKIGEQPIRVTDIDIMPGGLSSKFILRGINPSRINEEVVVHIDFSKVFTRKCDLNDFEKWSPHLPDECLFGHKITYYRKNRTQECFIDENLKYKKERGEDCDCTEHDFECDYNYVRNTTGQCMLFPGAQPIFRGVADQCANNKYWYELTGLRKLASSTCKGGPKSHLCPSSHSALFWIIIVLSPFVVVGILTICFINRRHGGGYGPIRLGSSIEPNSVLSSIIDIFYQIRMPRFVSRLWSNIPLPGRNRYHYSPVATEDGEVLMDDYEQDNEAL